GRGSRDGRKPRSREPQHPRQALNKGFTPLVVLGCSCLRDPQPVRNLADDLGIEIAGTQMLREPLPNLGPTTPGEPRNSDDWHLSLLRLRHGSCLRGRASRVVCGWIPTMSSESPKNRDDEGSPRV